MVEPSPLNPRRPRYTRRTILQLINSIAREIAEEHGGRIPDLVMIDARLRREFEAHPEMIELDKFVRDARKFWDRMNHKVVSGGAGTPVRFVPGAFVIAAPRSRVIMKKMTAIDLVGWGQIDQDATDKFLERVHARAEYRMRRLQEFSENPDCDALKDIEARLHGYVEKPGDEDTHLDGEEDADDEV